MKTARRLGIKTVAVYSEPDVRSKFVRMADEAVCIGPAASAESYLNMDRVLDAALKTGAQAVHPGYGFLSENAVFCETLEKNGITFIGPKAEAMRRMGLKLESKKIAKAANVSIIPGAGGGVPDPDAAIAVAKEIGYPVMVKASAGGGGKGMRVAYNDEQLREGFGLSLAEAKVAFKSDVMLVEKFIEEPRHIEIQVLLDRFGNGVYLNERECSIQRRNQKVIEEAPSTFLDAATRAAMGEQAVRLAKAVGYESAGTVEMLVDKHRKFYFLEMNTRLQVEHPITEMITGVDLVEQMIRVAAGHKLPFQQKDIGINGWALEARVYAEDPYRNFLPSIGRLTRYIEPSQAAGSGVRCDSGILEGSEISVYYDPLICKLVTHGKDRTEAIARMRKALDSYVIRGVTHNIPFLRAILDVPRFLEGNTTTKFISEVYPNGFTGTELTAPMKQRLLAGSVVIHAAALARNASISGALGSFKANAEKMIKEQISKLQVGFAGSKFEVSVEGVENGKLKVFITPIDGAAGTASGAPEVVTVESDYQSGDILTNCSITMADGSKHTSVFQLMKREPNTYHIIYHGTTFPVEILTPRSAALKTHMPIRVKADTHHLITSPMPGAVVSVNVKPGDKVLLGQEVCVVEAMKMQNSLKSPRDGVIKAVKVKKGDTVSTDETLMEFEH